MDVIFVVIPLRHTAIVKKLMIAVNHEFNLPGMCELHIWTIIRTNPATHADFLAAPAEGIKSFIQE